MRTSGWAWPDLDAAIHMALDATARNYGWTDEEIAASFRDLPR